MRPTRPIFFLTGLLAAGGIAAGCGATAMHPPYRTAATRPPNAAATNRASNARGSSAFAWLGSGSAPPATRSPRAATGGVLARPPGRRTLHGDHGSVSFVLRANGVIVGYLNATPRSGAETLANWSRFRPSHNRDEGDRDVRALAAITGVRVGRLKVSCVIDQYRTSLSRYREIACLVAGSGKSGSRSGASTVVLGAAPPSDWARQRPIIEHAIDGFVASGDAAAQRLGSAASV
jgi:hypothetical protein